MLIFGIDTCCMAATAALMDEERLLAQTVVNNKKTHSQKMMPQIEEMFNRTEISPEEIDYYAAAVGPGSFTGVRIGVATVKAMAQVFNKPCIAISTLHALANNVALFDGVICPILDARREQVYNSLFRGGRELKRLCEDRALAVSELLTKLREIDGQIMFCGDGVLVFKETIEKELGDRARFAPLMSNMNLAASVAELGMEFAKKGEAVSYGDLVPQYVRLSQAEREYMERKQG